MLIAQIDFEILEKLEIEEQSNAVYSLLASFLHDGRILDNNFSVFQKDNFLVTIVKIPGTDAFKNLKKQKYISENLKNLTKVRLSQPIFQILGKETELSELCKCKNSSAYLLFTNFLSIQSPIKCFECGYPIPLYRIKQSKPEQLRRTLAWQDEYKACDLLQIYCGFGERFGINQMSKLNSGLTKTGLSICQTIQDLTKKPCYYYLFRYNGKSLGKERERKCPSCNGEWFLDEQFLDLFDFRCDKCRLLSNIAFSLR